MPPKKDAPPKKDVPPAETVIAGFNNKETKLLAAAYLSRTAPDKYDFALLGHLAGFTEMTAKKFWPPVKKKAMDQYPEFAKYINGGSAAASNSKVTMGKRKAADSDTDAGADADLEVNPKVSSADIADGKAIKDKGKKAPGKAKRGKKVKVEEAEDEPSADGGDGMGEFVYQKNVVDWLEMTDGSAAVV